MNQWVNSVGSEGERKNSMSRREFLAISAAGIVGLAVGYFAGRATAPVKEVVKPQTVTQTKTETTTATTTATETLERTVTTTETETTTVEKEVLKVYERVKIANIRDLGVGKPLQTSYMGRPIVVLKLGEPAQGGVGPDNDIVAFSTLCTHMGGGLFYDPSNKALVCPLHYSVFDPARGGMVVVGHATEYLPQVILEYDENTGDIYAVGFNRLVYGVESNL